MVNLYNTFYVIKLIFAAGDSERFFDYIMIPRNSERIFKRGGAKCYNSRITHWKKSSTITEQF